MHIVAEEGFGIPQYSREAFELLAQNNVIDEQMTKQLKSMIGFRNIAVHDYQKLDITILQHIIENNLNELKNYTNRILSMY